VIRGTTSVIVHIGYPTHNFKSPMIYNPYFEQEGIDAVLVPMSCQPEHFPNLLRTVFTLDNVIGAVITMPHKVTVVGLLDEVSPAVRIAGSCNAVRKLPDGRLFGDMFDGEGFVRGIVRAGFSVDGARALVVGSGGVGSAIAASLAAASVSRLGLFDSRDDAASALAGRIDFEYPSLVKSTSSNDPAGWDLVVNATPLGMEPIDDLPFDPSRLSANSFVCDVVNSATPSRLLTLAAERGARTQGGSEMLYEQIPVYFSFFGLPTTTPDVLRSLDAGFAKS
jgi:shikimate dehydrogenase